MLTRLYTKAYLATRNDEGATGVEYGLLVALIAAVIVAVVYAIGQSVLGGFEAVNTELDKV